MTGTVTRTRTTRTRHLAKGDDGVAALELALVTVLLLLLGFGALPLYSMARSYQRVDHASAAATRFAAAVDANGRRNADGSYRRRPNADEVTAFARDSAGDSSLVVRIEVCPSVTPTQCTASDPTAALSGDVVRVTVSQTTDLSVLGSVANAVSSLVGAGDIAPKGEVTLSSTATSREE